MAHENRKQVHRHVPTNGDTAETETPDAHQVVVVAAERGPMLKVVPRESSLQARTANPSRRSVDVAGTDMLAARTAGQELGVLGEEPPCRGVAAPETPDPNAEAREWRTAFVAALEMKRNPEGVRRALEAGLDRAVWTKLQDEQGRPFRTFGAFCQAPPPFGLDTSEKEVRAFLEGLGGRRWTQMVTAPASAQGRRDGAGTSCPGGTKSSRHEKRMRAIAERAPEVVKWAYASKLLTGKEAEQFSKKRSSASFASSSAEVCLELERIKERLGEQIDDGTVSAERQKLVPLLARTRPAEGRAPSPGKEPESEVPKTPPTAPSERHFWDGLDLTNPVVQREVILTVIAIFKFYNPNASAAGMADKLRDLATVALKGQHEQMLKIIAAFPKTVAGVPPAPPRAPLDRIDALARLKRRVQKALGDQTFTPEEIVLHLPAAVIPTFGAPVALVRFVLEMHPDLFAPEVRYRATSVDDDAESPLRC